MKILKYGEGYPRTVTCEHCGSELEYTMKDLDYSEYTIVYPETHTEEVHWEEHINCPVCTEMIQISDKVLCTCEMEVCQVPKLTLDLIEQTKKKRWWQR